MHSLRRECKSLLSPSLVRRRRQALDVLRAQLIQRVDSEESHTELDFFLQDCEMEGEEMRKES